MVMVEINSGIIAMQTRSYCNIYLGRARHATARSVHMKSDPKLLSWGRAYARTHVRRYPFIYGMGMGMGMGQLYGYGYGYGYGIIVYRLL